MVIAVHLHVGQDRGHLERVHEVGLTGMANLALVLQRRENVGPAQQFEVGVRVVIPDLFQQVFETDHDKWCLMRVMVTALQS